MEVLESVNSAPHLARITRAFFSRVAQAHMLHLCCVLSPKQSFSRACHVSHFAWSCFFIICSTPTSSSLPFLQNRTNLCAPQWGLLFGRFAEQSPLTGYEANAPVELSSTEVTTTLSSRKEIIGPTCNSEERSANPLRICHSKRESSETPSSRLRTGTEKPVAMCSNNRKSSRDTHVVREPARERERILSEHRGTVSLKKRGDQASRGEKELFNQNNLKQEYLLPESRSELNKQELMVENAGRDLHESGLQLHSPRMELYQAIQLSDQSQRAKCWLCTELDRNERFLQEGRMKSLEEIEELQQLCCAVAERAKQLRQMIFLIKIKSIWSESVYGSKSGTTRPGELPERYQRILWSWNGKQFWVVPRSLSACECSE